MKKGTPEKKTLLKTTRQEKDCQGKDTPKGYATIFIKMHLWKKALKKGTAKK